MEHLHERVRALRGWVMVDGKKIRKGFTFHDFKEAMEFVNAVAAIAERAGHHPDIGISYNKVSLTLWTHDAEEITEKDVCVAADIDALSAREYQ